MVVLSEKEYKHRNLIVALSIVIPLAVAILFNVKIEGYDFSFLPPIYAGINALTALLLIIAVIAIRQKNMILHQKLMKSCIVLSALFLLMYVVYHMTSESTAFGGEGVVRYFYYFILITHIILSISIIPLVLFTFVRALTERYDKHKKLAKITFPIWLYVAVTGVIIYLMISPYYVR